MQHVMAQTVCGWVDLDLRSYQSFADNYAGLMPLC